MTTTFYTSYEPYPYIPISNYFNYARCLSGGGGWIGFLVMVGLDRLTPITSVEVISSNLVVRKQRNTLRFATIWLNLKTSLSLFSTSIVPKLTVAFSFVSKSLVPHYRSGNREIRNVSVRYG